MPKFSKRSLGRLSTCHPDLQRLFMEVIKEVDCTIIEGARSKELQNKYFAEGKSKLKWPHGKHNITSERPLSLAADVMPYPVEYPQDTDSKAEIRRKLDKITKFALKVLSIAERLKIKVRWGGDWNMNGNLNDDKWDDLPHFELLQK